MTSAAPRSMPQRPRMPTLDLAAPRRIGLAAVLALVALGNLAANLTIPAGPVTSARGRIRAEPVPIRHTEGGLVARLHVREGADVDAGQVVATLDPRLIDSQIAGLKRQMDGLRLSASGLKQEAEALAATERGATQRQRLSGLESQITAADQELIGLEVRLAMAEQEKQRTEIRAPLAGRIFGLAISDATSIAPNAVLASIQPASDRLIIEAVWPADHTGTVAVGQAVLLRPVDAAIWSQPLPGTVDQVLAIERSSDAPQRVRLRITADLTGSPLTTRSAAPDPTFAVQLVTGTPSLLSEFLAPLTTHRTLSLPKAQP